MVNEVPTHCPRCGTALDPVDPPTVHHCPACEKPVFYNPVPAARVAVIDEDAVLLVQVPGTEPAMWGTPGGMVEADEDPAVTGARELKEETCLEVDPDSLELFDARTFAKFGTVQKTSLCFAVGAAAVSGTPTPGPEVAAVRFWSVAAFADRADTMLSSWPDAHQELSWWIEEARAAVG
ncbi:MAG: NUDIX domain-containing protein [Halobacteriaceae archaeon]